MGTCVVVWTVCYSVRKIRKALCQEKNAHVLCMCLTQSQSKRAFNYKSLTNDFTPIFSPSRRTKTSCWICGISRFLSLHLEMAWVILFHMVLANSFIRCHISFCEHSTNYSGQRHSTELCVIERNMSTKCIKCNKISILNNSYSKNSTTISNKMKKEPNCGWFIPNRTEPIWSDPIKSFLFLSLVEWKQNKPKDSTYRCVCLMNDGNTCVHDVRDAHVMVRKTSDIHHKKDATNEFRIVKITEFAPFHSFRFLLS